MLRLNDEVAETREEAHRLWNVIGLQYQNENENDLKDQLDYLYEEPKHYFKHCMIYLVLIVGSIITGSIFSETSKSWLQSSRTKKC